jgi:hypothetical protein
MEMRMPAVATSSLLRLCLVVFLGAASFGLLVGSWAALSASPIVKTVLPLLFTIISGAGAFKFAQSDPVEEKNYRSLTIFGTAAFGFSIFCVIGTLVALYIQPLLIAHLDNRRQHVDISTLPTNSPLFSKPFDAVMLRNWLEVVGIDNNEIKVILATAPAPIATTSTDEKIDASKSGTYEYMLSSLKGYYNDIVIRNAKVNIPHILTSEDVLQNQNSTFQNFFNQPGK